jgi:alanine racemase
VVKADAYGHGAVEVSKKLFEEKVSFLAVAFTGEAIELREAGIKSPIIVLFDTGYIKEFFDFKLIPVIYNVDTASSLSAEAKKKNIIIKVHVKIDTGMGRLGLSGNHIVNDLIKISEMGGIELAGLLSHFSEADLSDRSYAVLQLNRFNKIRETISKILKRKIFSHIANSAAVLTFEDAYLDAVRPGLMLYGYSPINQKSEVSPPTHPSPARRMAGGPSRVGIDSYRGEGKGGGGF